MLWRSTFGRLQSAEAAQRAAEQRIVSLGEVIDSQASETEKLASQLAKARGEYAASLAQLKGAASELRGLASKVDSTDRKARALMQDLRELRSKHALQMRSDLAIKASALAKQKASVDKIVAGLAKDGL
jgi:DNA repair ATPase RecN